ncbi:Mth938-like domain-containing protein [Sandaracinobacter sp. RS1-74]|uniref:Mth938-like domain-containing protein n=1 Tax=Sandaracinobacteroides sayramensis TaxID=2913411 RepID=UPI001EDB68C0|nr:Mth938-like domain-containing protein [Sandaracinobacteroides sayramensis]MCG2842812.1 Mth938-like domain-containing protein [Sandaracinobacteroides sayramensis]
MSGVRLEPGASRIAGRAAGGWVVGNRLYQPALWVTAGLAGSLPGLTFPDLDAGRLPDPGAIELLLLGTGERLLQPARAFVEGARLRGWRVEAMDSAAAARTFNVLVAEERLVGALIL